MYVGIFSYRYQQTTTTDQAKQGTYDIGFMEKVLKEDELTSLHHSEQHRQPMCQRSEQHHSYALQGHPQMIPVKPTYH